MAGRLAHDLLERERGAVEQLQDYAVPCGLTRCATACLLALTLYQRAGPPPASQGCPSFTLHGPGRRSGATSSRKT
jgi:hypothetical protein